VTSSLMVTRLPHFVDARTLGACSLASTRCGRQDFAPSDQTSHIAFDELHTAPYLRRQDLKLVASDHEHVVRSIEPDDFESRRRHRDEDPAERASST